MMDKYNAKESMTAQREYCDKNGYPHFAPRNGMCRNCRKNIYDKYVVERGTRDFITGITVDKASSELITGCPHCNRTYCD